MSTVQVLNEQVPCVIDHQLLESKAAREKVPVQDLQTLDLHSYSTRVIFYIILHLVFTSNFRDFYDRKLVAPGKFNCFETQRQLRRENRKFGRFGKFGGAQLVVQ